MKDKTITESSTILELNEKLLEFISEMEKSTNVKPYDVIMTTRSNVNNCVNLTKSEHKPMKDKKILTEEDGSFFKTIDAMYRKNFETKEDPIIDVIEELIKYKNQLLAKKMEEVKKKIDDQLETVDRMASKDNITSIPLESYKSFLRNLI